MTRIIKTAKEGYLFTEIADVPTEERTWAKVKDAVDFTPYHEVPIAVYEDWKRKMDKLQEEFIG